MLPLVSLFAFSASVAAAATHDIQSRDTCSCLSPAAQTFANSAAVADAANKVTTPTGYTNTGGASSQWATGDGCLGFVNIDNYDSNVCAGICDTITECSTFQIYYEQGASGSPQAKCSFWGGVVDTSKGSTISNPIGACNTYTSSKVVPPSGFDTPQWYGNAAFDYSSGSAAAASYIGSKVFPDGSYDTSRCADEMSSRGGSFYNTYLLHSSDSAQQYCDVYSDVPSTGATYTGKTGGKDNTTISNSFGCGKSLHSDSDADSWYNWAKSSTTSQSSSSTSSTRSHSHDTSYTTTWTRSHSSDTTSTGSETTTSHPHGPFDSTTTTDGTETSTTTSHGLPPFFTTTTTTTGSNSESVSTTSVDETTSTTTHGLPFGSSTTTTGPSDSTTTTTTHGFPFGSSTTTTGSATTTTTSSHYGPPFDFPGTSTTWTSTSTGTVCLTSSVYTVRGLVQTEYNVPCADVTSTTTTTWTDSQTIPTTTSTTTWSGDELSSTTTTTTTMSDESSSSTTTSTTDSTTASTTSEGQTTATTTTSDVIVSTTTTISESSTTTTPSVTTTTSATPSPTCHSDEPICLNTQCNYDSDCCAGSFCLALSTASGGYNGICSTLPQCAAGTTTTTTTESLTTTTTESESSTTTTDSETSSTTTASVMESTTTTTTWGETTTSTTSDVEIATTTTTSSDDSMPSSTTTTSTTSDSESSTTTSTSSDNNVPPSTTTTTTTTASTTSTTTSEQNVPTTTTSAASTTTTDGLLTTRTTSTTWGDNNPFPGHSTTSGTWTATTSGFPAGPSGSSVHICFTTYEELKRSSNELYLAVAGGQISYVSDEADATAFDITSDGRLECDDGYIGVPSDGDLSSFSIYTESDCESQICHTWSMTSGSLDFSNGGFSNGKAAFYSANGKVFAAQRGAAPAGYLPVSCGIKPASPSTSTTTTVSQSTTTPASSSTATTTSSTESTTTTTWGDSTTTSSASTTQSTTTASTTESTTSIESTTTTSASTTESTTQTSTSESTTTTSFDSTTTSTSTTESTTWTTTATASTTESTTTSESTTSTSASTTQSTTTAESTTTSTSTTESTTTVESTSTTTTSTTGFTTTASTTESTTTTDSTTTSGTTTSYIPEATFAPNSTYGGNYTYPGNATYGGNFTYPVNGTYGGNATYPTFNFTNISSNYTNDNGTLWKTWNVTENMTQAFGAASIINAMGFTDFCSTLLGYTTPVTTEYVPVTETLPVTETITEGTLSSGTATTWTTVPTTLTITQADPAWQRLAKRTSAPVPVSTPAALSNYTDAAVSQACSWKATPVSVTSTISVTTTDTAYTTIYVTVPETTVPATTEIDTATSTFTVNTCEPTAPSQLIKNPSFECYKSGWDTDLNGAILYWGPNNTATPDLDGEAQAYLDTLNTTSASNATGAAPSDGSSGAPAQSLGRRQDDGVSSDGSAHPPTDLYTPYEPAYDGSTYVRLSPAWNVDPDSGSAGLGQIIDNLATGSYWMAYKYRVPTYALNNEQCQLNVLINDIPVMGPAIPSLVDATDGWQPAGGFFYVPDELSGPAYLYFDFYCPPLDFKKVKRQDGGQPAGSSDTEYPAGFDISSYQQPDAIYPLLDLDYIRMGVDDGGWDQYRGAAPADTDTNAASVSADVATSAAALQASQGSTGTGKEESK